MLTYCKTAMISTLEALVLDLLAAKAPTYGLDLVHASRGRLKRGSVYVTLGRMEQKGFVTSMPARIMEGDLPLGAFE